MYRFKALVLLLVVAVLSNTASAQLSSPTQLNGRQYNQFINAITTAVPFLTIAPDSRSGALGDAGVALSPDANLIHWNPAKLGFVEKDVDVSVSYSPWLRALVNDMSLSYISGYKKLNKRQAIGGSLRYFTLGNITFTDDAAQVIRDFKPAEVAIDMAFGQQLSKRLSGGFAARFINSNLTGSTNVAGAESKPGRSVAVDISMFYTNSDLKLFKKDARFNWGFNVSNIGAKMRYTNSNNRDFIPTNLKLGAALTSSMDKFNQLTLTFDVNKLLVPTKPIYNNTKDTIISGMDPNVGPAQGIIQSFYDAPGQYDATTKTILAGSKFKEELREVNLSGGLEYWYDQQFAVRTGYFYEHYTKGNRQFLTLGLGLRYNVMTLDMSYLISTTQQNPLANTLRFTIKFTLGGGTKASSAEETPAAE